MGAVEGQASISVDKTVDSVTPLPRVTFGIDKSVDKSAIIMNPGESSDITYTINVTRTEAEQTSYTISGTITAENGPQQGTSAIVTKVEDAVEYHSEGSDWIEVKRVEVFSGEKSIAPGNSEPWTYSFTFTAPAGAETKTWHNVAYVTVSNAGGIHADQPYKTEKGFVLPGDAEVSEEVQVSDVESISPDNGSIGYQVTSVTWDETSSSSPDGPWTVTPPETITVHKTVTTSATATPGIYTLHNTAAIVEGPSDEADVTITIPSPPPSGGGGGGEQPSGGGGGGTTSGGGGGGGGGEQGATVTTEAAPAPAPEQVAVLSVVVSQPASAPEVVAQAPAAKQLPFTGVNSWYLSLAVLLIMTGSLLQFVGYKPRHLGKAK